MNAYRGRGLRHWLVTFVATAFVIVVVGLIYNRAVGLVITLDMTQSRGFSLSKETLDVIARVEKPIRITGFYSTAVLRARELDASIIRLYEDASGGMITSRFINPDEQPGLTAQFQVEQDGSLYASYVTDAGDVDMASLTSVVIENNQERNITSAILRLLELNRFTVAFDNTFSDVNPYDTTTRGFSGMFNGLAANGIQVTSLDLAGIAARGEDVPASITTVVLVRVRQHLPQNAIDVLDRFLKRGGSLFIMADADASANAFLSESDPFNDYLWQNYGIRMLDAIAVDLLSNSGSELDLLSYATSDGSSITGRLNDVNNVNSRTLFRIARAIEIDPTPPVNNGMVLATSPQSYGETNFTSLLGSNMYEYSVTEDVAGPLNVAAWAHNESLNARVLLVGDIDWATNGLVMTPEGNAILFTDGMAWLTGFGEQLVFAPSASSVNLPTVFLSVQELDNVALITVVLMPLAAVLSGVGIWWVRNRR